MKHFAIRENQIHVIRCYLLGITKIGFSHIHYMHSLTLSHSNLHLRVRRCIRYRLTHASLKITLSNFYMNRITLAIVWPIFSIVINNR